MNFETPEKIEYNKIPEKSELGSGETRSMFEISEKLARAKISLLEKDQKKTEN